MSEHFNDVDKNLRCQLDYLQSLGRALPGSTRALEDNTNKKKKLIDSVEFFHRTVKNKSNKNNFQNTLSDSHQKFLVCIQMLILYITK